MFHVLSEPNPMAQDAQQLQDQQDNSFFSKQLCLEVELRRSCLELVQSYRESQNWESLSEVAQVLVTNSARIVKLKQQIKGNIVQTLPYLLKCEASVEAHLNSLPCAAYEEECTSEARVSLSDESEHPLGISTLLTEASSTTNKVTKDLSKSEERNTLQQTHQDYSVEAKKDCPNGEFLEGTKLSPVVNNLNNQGKVERKESCKLKTHLGNIHSVNEHSEITHLSNNQKKKSEQMEGSLKLSSTSMIDELSDISVEVLAIEDSSGHALDDRVNYASSESSGEFYSSCNSLHLTDTRGSEEDKENAHFDKQSKDKSPAREDYQLSPAHRVTVSKCGLDYSDGVYHVELNANACHGRSVVVKNHAQIVQLRDQLNSAVNDNHTTLSLFHSNLERVNDDSGDSSHDLEQFLNEVASSSDFYETVIFTNFFNSSDGHQDTCDSSAHSCPLIIQGTGEM